MNYMNMRKRAARITRSRSLKPDIQYILYAFALSITLAGLPAAYGIVREYQQYLIKCRSGYDAANKDKKLTYPHREPSQVTVHYNKQSFAGTLKAILFVFFPGALFIGRDDLSDMQNLENITNLNLLKSMFADVFVIELLEVLLFVFLFVLDSTYILFIILGMAVLAVIGFVPFVTYCQALVMFRKACEDVKPYEYEGQE